MKNFFSRPETILYFAFFALHIIVGFANSVPVYFSDESGYIQRARMIAAGLGMHDPTNPFPQHFSIILSPFFFFSLDSLKVYPFIQIFNFLIGSFIPVLVFKIISLLRSELELPKKIGITVLCCIYPTYLVFANLAIPETLLTTGTIFLFFMVTNLATGQFKPLNLFFTILILIVLPIIQARGFTVSIPAGLILGYLWLKQHSASLFSKKVMLQVAGLAIFVLLVLATTFITLVNNNAYMYSWSTFAIFPKLTNLEYLKNYFLAHIGTIWYLGIATMGLAYIGFLGVIFSLRRRGLSRQEFCFLLFTLSTALFTLFLTTFTDLRSDAVVRFSNRADALIYGRYIENILIPLMIYGFIWLYEKERAARTYFLTFSAIFSVITLILWKTRATLLSQQSMFWMQVQGLSFIRFWMPEFGFYFWPFVLTATISAVILMLAIYRSLNMFTWCIGIYFFANSLTSIFLNLQINDSRVKRVDFVLVDPIKAYLEESGKQTIEFIQPNLFWQRDLLRILLPLNVNVLVSKSEVPFFEASISDKNLRPLGGRILGKGRSEDNYLWLLPGTTQNKLEARGYLLPADFPSPLPEEAYKVELKVSEANWLNCINMASRYCLEIKAKHTGSGSFWPGGIFFKITGFGVLAEVAITDSNGQEILYSERVDLTENVYPGQSTKVYAAIDEAMVRKFAKDGVVQLQIDLVQKDVRHFLTGYTKPLRAQLGIATGNLKPL